jgi:GDP-L-fucose synthase
MEATKKIFLTGGGGFIGRNIIEQLGDKYEFIAPRSLDLDLTDSDKVLAALKSCGPDLVIHAANIGGKRSDPNAENVTYLNLKMFHNIVRAKKYFGRMIMFGSGAEYDKQFGINNVKEDCFDTKVPIDQYGFYKYACAKFAEQVDYITHLRIFGMFGKYEDSATRFISNNICRTLLDLPVSVNQNVYFEFVFIDDFIKILDHFINNPGKHKFYNIGNGSRDSLLDIGRIILEKSKKDLGILVKEDGLGKAYTCDSERLRNEIPDIRFTSIGLAIDRLFSYYSKNINNVKKEDILFD